MTTTITIKSNYACAQTNKSLVFYLFYFLFWSTTGDQRPLRHLCIPCYTEERTIHHPGCSRREPIRVVACGFQTRQTHAFEFAESRRETVFVATGYDRRSSRWRRGCSLLWETWVCGKLLLHISDIIVYFNFFTVIFSSIFLIL